jgi:hypothetical protein
MTEQEAKTKFCPYKKVEHEHTLLSAEMRKIGSELCVASDCMMWRIPKTWVTPEGQPTSGQDELDKGYCGLAGKP